MKVYFLLKPSRVSISGFFLVSKLSKTGVAWSTLDEAYSILNGLFVKAFRMWGFGIMYDGGCGNSFMSIGDPYFYPAKTL